MSSVRNFPNESIFTVNNNYFDLSTFYSGDQLKMIMQTRNAPITTADLPHTYEVVSKIYPEVFKTQCFNSLQLPFSEEIKCTELGHLFEHFLIQSLLDAHIKNNPQIDACIDATTDWNWQRDPRGTFHIHIKNIPLLDPKLVSESLIKSNDLMQLILLTQKTTAIKIN